MQRFELLTILPTSVSCMIVGDWLDIKSIYAMNSAYCCHSHRSMFLDLVHSDDFYISEQVIITNESKLWDVLEEIGRSLKFVVFAEPLKSPHQYNLVTSHCKNLTHVRFRRYCAFSRVLPSIKKVVWLDMSGTNLSCIPFVSDKPICRNLRSLGLASTDLTDSLLLNFADRCPRIAHLDISYNTKLTDSGILSFLVKINALRGLNIQGCSRFTDTCLGHIVTHCARTLHTLQMNCYSKTEKRNPVFSVAAINALLVRCTQLRTLHIAGSVSSSTVVHTTPTITCNPTTLVLGDLDSIDSLVALFQSCPNLHTILTYALYSASHLVSLARRVSNLKEVYLMARNPHKGFVDTAAHYAQNCTDRMKTIRPDLIVKCIYTENDYSVHDVMSL